MQTLQQRKTDISVIVPVYDLEDYLTPLLESLKRQDKEYAIEYIFVLNNCTDKSEEVIKNSGLDCTILTCEKQGCGHARNVGFEHSHGEYIWFMDGDDWLLRDTAIGDVVYGMRKQNLDILRVPFTSDKFRMNYFSMVWQYVMRRDFIEEFRFTGRQPGEDDEYMIKVLKKAGYSPATFMQMPYYYEPLYFYNYMRIGSNMFRVAMGENINGDE